MHIYERIGGSGGSARELEASATAYGVSCLGIDSERQHTRNILSAIHSALPGRHPISHSQNLLVTFESVALVSDIR